MVTETEETKKTRGALETLIIGLFVGGGLGALLTVMVIRQFAYEVPTTCPALELERITFEYSHQAFSEPFRTELKVGEKIGGLPKLPSGGDTIIIVECSDRSERLEFQPRPYNDQWVVILVTTE